MSLKYKKLITNSEIQAFKNCRLNWKFAYDEKLKPIEPSPKLFLGAGVHQALAEYYQDENRDKHTLFMAFDGWFDESLGFIKTELKLIDFDDEKQAEYEEIYNLGIIMLENYYNFAQENDNFEVVSVEKEYTIPIYTPNGFKSRIYYKAKPDLVIRDDIGYWLMDHKTAISLNTDIYELDEQATSYILATQSALNIVIKGIIYNILRKKIPKIPKLLKDEQLSKNKSIDTTYEVYWETIKKHNLIFDDYDEILKILLAKGNTFFKREKFYRNQNEIRNQNYRIYNIAHDIYAGKGAKIYYRPNRDCGWRCAYKDLCLAQQDGSDIDYLIGSLFKKL